jgi:hypothetical protein
MRLVTIAASLVPRGGAALLRLVTISAVFGQASRVRLMTRRALSVPRGRERALGCMARAAAGDSLLRAMREPRVAALTGLMPGVRLHTRELRGVATRASPVIRRFAHEIMRRVAALAGDAGVELLIAGRVLVTRAAIPHARARLSAGGVRVVAADAGPDFPLLRMVRVLVGVAARTSLVGATLHVVGGVAARALAMTRSVPGAEHGQIFVTGPTSDGLFLAKLMGLVAADAGHVTGFEQRRRGHDRFALLVTGHARGQRLGASRVLLLMARRANLIRSLAPQGVGGLNVLVAVLAGA